MFFSRSSYLLELIVSAYALLAYGKPVYGTSATLVRLPKTVANSIYLDLIISRVAKTKRVRIYAAFGYLK